MNRAINRQGREGAQRQAKKGKGELYPGVARIDAIELSGLIRVCSRHSRNWLFPSRSIASFAVNRFYWLCFFVPFVENDL
jgi:hypothetical protein